MQKPNLPSNLKACLFICLLLTAAVPASAQLENEGHTLSVGYINKNWVTDFSGESYIENIFGQEKKRLHGMQIAYRYNMYSLVGVGLQTGLSYEWCMSLSDEVKKAGFDRFNEHSLHVPLHAIVRIPVAKKASIAPYAGVGVNWKISANMKSGELSDSYGYGTYWGNRWYGDYTRVSYGKNGWPKALNAQLEFGANIRIDDFVLGVSYARGLTNHKFYSPEKTRQDKLAITLGVCIE